MNKLIYIVGIIGSFLWILLLFLIISLGIIGCSAKTQYINIPVPMQCDYNLTAAIIPDINGTQAILNSLISIAENYKKLRNDIKAIPCIRIIE